MEAQAQLQLNRAHCSGMDGRRLGHLAGATGDGMAPIYRWSRHAARELVLDPLTAFAKPQLFTDETVRTILSVSLVASGIAHAAWFHDAPTGVLLLDAVLIAIAIALSGSHLRILHCR